MQFLAELAFTLSFPFLLLSYNSLKVFPHCHFKGGFDFLIHSYDKDFLYTLLGADTVLKLRIQW